MNDSKIYIKYRTGGAVYTDDHYQTQHYFIEDNSTDNQLKLTIIPREKLELIDFQIIFSRKYASKDHFFVNGYQSWTTSTECTIDDKLKGVTKLVEVFKCAKPLAAISGDYLFKKKAYKKAGVFHSHTYTYIRNEDKVELWGSLSERSGYTIFNADMNNDTFSIEKDVAGLVIDSQHELCNIIKFEGAYDEVFDKYFAAMGIAKPKIDHLSGYTSWYNYFQKINEEIILRDLKGLTKVKDSSSIFQIDDGYETFVGDWLDPCPKFPRGMKFIADRVHEEGFLAGIWLAPFNAQKVSRVAKEHPDWLIKNSKGQPLLGCAGWGGAYTLDIYNPEARAYIKNVFNVVLNEWGYDLVKLDFLYSQCMEPRNGKTRGTIMVEAMEFLRECCGDKLILGCGVPLGAAFGYVDACRISCDVDLKYPGKFYSELLHINNEVPSARLAINNTIFRRHLNGRVFVNDPDVFFLRSNNLKFTQEQKILLARINNMFGNVLFISDDVNEYSQENIAILKKAFKQSKAIILSAEFTDRDYITICYLEDGAKKKFSFVPSTGESDLVW